MTAVTTPTLKNASRVYVGTFGKYNSGSIAGAWLDLADYEDAEAFHKACRELHKWERDPEFMFQDWENIPSGFIHESGFNDPEGLWEWLEMDDDERELVTLYRDEVDSGAGLEKARDMFYGRYESEEAFAIEHTYEDSSELDKIVNTLGIVIDWKATWNSYLRHYFSSVYHKGEYWIFINS